MGFKCVLFGALLISLLGVILICINIFAQNANDEETKILGATGLIAAGLLLLYGFAWKWNGNERPWTFYLVFIPVFVTSSFDCLTMLDIWRDPNGFFLMEYLRAKDYHVHNVVFMSYAFVNGTVLLALNFVTLYKFSSGNSSRSLLLISATGLCLMSCVYAFCVATSGLPMHLLTKTFMALMPLAIVGFPVGALKVPRSFTLSHNPGSGIVAKCLALFALTSNVAAVGVFVAKALVLNGVRSECLEIVRVNDPLIFLNDVEETFPFIAALIWENLIVSLPLLIIFSIYHLKSTKPTFLWELSVINLSSALVNQLTFITGSLFWKTPKSLQADPANVTFWAINMIPIAAALLQLISVLPFRVLRVSGKTRVKKTL